jgi:predicted amidohydrolase YtcJ
VTADLVLRGGRVLTLDPASTVAEALAVRDGTIVAVGSDTEVGSAPQIIDLAGRTVIPGFVDTHCHFEEAGTDEDTVSFDGARTVADVVERVRAAARRTPEGEWIRGRIWHPVSQLAERRRPNRDELDAATTAHPVHLPVGHSSILNSLALRAAGIGRDTPDPQGGTIERDPHGEPTGVLEEAAERLVTAALPPWPRSRRAAQLRRAMRVLNGLGITSAVAGAMTPLDVEILRELRNAGGATVRVGAVVAPTGELNPGVDLDTWAAWFAAHPAPDEDDAWVREVGIKLQADGGMTLRTAALREPYDGGTDRGELVVDLPRLTDLARTAAQAGWRVAVHAVGDRGIDLVLDAFDAVHATVPIDGRRFVLIHASLVTRDQLRRAARLGLHLAVQSVFLWDKTAAIRANLGDERAERAVPLRTIVDALGIDAVSAGTDYPVNPLDPLVNLAVMTTRRDAAGQLVGAAEAVTREEALRLLTSPRYTFDDDHAGVLAPGRRADLAVLSGDPLTVDDDRLRELRVDLTVVDGRVVHERKAVPA